MKIKQVLSDIDAFIRNTLISNISVTEEYDKPSLSRSNVSKDILHSYLAAPDTVSLP